MSDNVAMLKRVGAALYGDRWVTALAGDLGLSNGVRLHQWMRGDRPMPEVVVLKLRALVRERQAVLDMIMADLAEGCPG